MSHTHLGDVDTASMPVLDFLAHATLGADDKAVMFLGNDNLDAGLDDL
jgi:hypothetical protein